MSLEEKGLDALKAICVELGVPLSVIGNTGGASLKIGSLVDISLDSAHCAFSGSLERLIASS